MPDENIRAMTDADVFRAVQPRQWGGLEIDPSTFFEAVIRIGSACGSSGWIAGLVGGHAWLTAMFPQEAQQEVWGENPDARISTSLAPTGKAERVTDGFHLTGTLDLRQWRRSFPVGRAVRNPPRRWGGPGVEVLPRACP